MKQAIHLKTPLSEKDLMNLKIGDLVNISGVIYTARDAAHKRLVELLENEKPLPFEIKNQIIYYVGPTPAPAGKIIGSAGPTTSYRIDTYTPQLLKAGLKGMIGKGPRSLEVLNSIKNNKAVYFAAVGGAGALISKTIKKAELVAYQDLGAEAIYKLQVENFPCIVANDIFGNDLYREGIEKYKRRNN